MVLSDIFHSVISDTLFHFPDVNRKAGIFAGKEVKYLQAFSGATFSPCPSLLPGEYARFTHPYTVLLHDRGTPAPAQVLHLPVMCFSSQLEGHFTEMLHPHLNIGRGAENAQGGSDPALNAAVKRRTASIVVSDWKRVFPSFSLKAPVAQDHS